MKNIIITFIFCGLFSSLSIGQLKPKLNTNGKGSLFLQFSYNSSIYSPADISLQGEDYNIVLKNTTIRDNYEGKGLSSFFSSSSPQFGAKIGYYIADKWAITLNFDRYNTFFADQQEVILDGTFEANSNSTYSGTYNDQTIHLDRDEFHLQQRKGINYLSIGLQRADQLYKSNSAAFTIQTIIGIKLGTMLSTVEYTYDHSKSKGTPYFGGFGGALNFGVRFDIAQHLFIQIGADGGILSQGKINLHSNKFGRARQVVGFFSPNVSLGFSIFTNQNNCGTCPQW